MKALSILLLLSVALLCTGIAQAADDMTGHWSGKYEWTRPDGETVDTPVYMILKQDGNKLTGTAGESLEERPMNVTGTVDGNKVELSIVGPNRQNKITGNVNGKLITGNSAITGFQGQELKVQVKIKKIS